MAACIDFLFLSHSILVMFHLNTVINDQKFPFGGKYNPTRKLDCLLIAHHGEGSLYTCSCKPHSVPWCSPSAQHCFYLELCPKASSCHIRALG